jgi:hypothetical protein
VGLACLRANRFNGFLHRSGASMPANLSPAPKETAEAVELPFARHTPN